MVNTSRASATPRLRFPEFRKTTGWQNTALGSVLVEHGLKSDGKSEVHSVSLHKGLVNQIEHLGRSFAATDTSNYNLVRPCDVVYTKSPTGDFPYGIVKQSRLSHDAIVSPLYGVFAPEDEYVGWIIDAFFESPARAARYLEPIVKKGAKNTIQISNARFLSGAIPLPADKAEQRKVGQWLAVQSELIAGQAAKVKTLRRHRRGLMQQLLICANETVPRLRFPEFGDQPAWNETKAGSLFANRTERGEAGLPIYSVTMHDGMVRRSSLDRDFSDIEDPSGNKKACKGDIAYNMMRMWQGALGVAVENCLVSPAYVVLKPEKGVVSEFFAYLFKVPSTLLLLTSHSRGLTKDRLRLYYDDFARITLRCPSPAEQQRIADCLASIDTEIANESAKLDELRRHKAGLMQRLFESPEEE